MALKLITPPSGTPVTLAEAKAQCRIDGSDEDAMLNAYIAAATATAEHELGAKLISQTWEAVFDTFPEGAVELNAPRVQSIVSVTYLAPDGSTTVLSSGAYVLDADNTPGWLFPVSGTDWPQTAESANAVRIRFTCGYGPAATDVPANVRQWILMHIATAYRNREAMAQGVSINELPNRYVDGLLDSERQYNL